jgi:hypothetical protein
MANDLMHETIRRAKEVLSLLSCAANVIVGTGDREVTLSAGSWELRVNGRNRAVRCYGVALVTVIDAMNLPFDGRNHCSRAWIEHAPIWAKVADDRA